MWYYGEMPKSLSMYKVKFVKTGDQSKWIYTLALSVREIARICGCSERTVRDWRREKFLMGYDDVQKLCEKAKRAEPPLQKVERYAHTQDAGRKGARAMLRKYGAPKVD